MANWRVVVHASLIFRRNLTAPDGLSRVVSERMSEVDLEDREDVALMARVRDGDHLAFQTLLERHQNRVVGTVTKMLGSSREAEDLAQQVFIRVWKSAPRYQPTAKFTTWLMTITRNLVFNEVRRRGRASLVSIDEMDADGREVQLPDSDTQSASREFLDNELRDAIDAAILKLPEQQRLAVVLRRYDEMPYEEIAVVLGTTVPAVKSLLFRARSELKRLLASYLDGE